VIGAQVVIKLYQRTNCLGESEFDSCMEQFLVSLYLLSGRTSDY